MPRIRPERKAERRAQVVAAARTCSARSGFHNATLQDVFAEAGLSAGCVYNYFRSKDELMLAIAEERHEDEWRLIAEASEMDDPIAALRQVAQTFADLYLKDDGLDKRNRLADVVRSTNQSFHLVFSSRGNGRTPRPARAIDTAGANCQTADFYP